MALPEVIVVLSGKRKSGKDYVAEKVQCRVGTDVCAVLRLSGPLKTQYAKEHNLDISRLLDSSEYKEKYRKDMIQWGEEKRNKDPEFFCRIATSGQEAEKSMWIISDARRSTDVEYFLRYHQEITLTVRIEADLSTREKRGFQFQSGVDDAESECGLDKYSKWNYVINNDTDETVQKQSFDTNKQFLLLLQDIKTRMKQSK